MSVVNTNVSASLAQAALNKNQRALGTAMEQLSTGSKINSAKDDAAGLAMASKFTAQIKGLDMAVKNANDAISMISTAEGAMTEVTSMLQRMRELAVQSSNGTVTSEDRGYMDLEYQALEDEINRIADNTQWNGENVLDGTAGSGSGSSSSVVTFQVSANYTAGATGSAEVPFQAAEMYGASDILGDLNIAALYDDGATSEQTAADTNFTAASMNTALGVTNLEDTGATDTTAASPVLYTADSFVAETFGAAGISGVTELYSDGATSSNGRAAQDLTKADLLATIQKADTSAVDTLYSDGTFTGVAAGAFELTDNSSLDAWKTAIDTAVSAATITVKQVEYGSAGGGNTATDVRDHELYTAFVAAHTAQATDPSSPALGETEAAAFTATNTLLNDQSDKLEFANAIADYDTANVTTVAASVSAAFTAADNTDEIGHVVTANAGTDLTVNDDVETWKAAAALYDSANGTSIATTLDTLTSGVADTAALSTVVESAGAATNALLGDSDSLEDWKAAIQLYDSNATLSAAFDTPHANESAALNSVVKTPEVAFQAEGAPSASNDVITVDFGDLGADVAHLASTGVTTQADSQTAIAQVDNALTSINSQRAEFGAATNRLEYAVDNMTNTQNNAEASRSRIMDTDYAETTSELAKAQIIAQAGTAMLAQANQSAQSVLSLLR